MYQLVKRKWFAPLSYEVVLLHVLAIATVAMTVMLTAIDPMQIVLR